MSIDKSTAKRLTEGERCWKRKKHKYLRTHICVCALPCAHSRLGSTLLCFIFFLPPPPRPRPRPRAPSLSFSSSSFPFLPRFYWLFLLLCAVRLPAGRTKGEDTHVYIYTYIPSLQQGDESRIMSPFLYQYIAVTSVTVWLFSPCKHIRTYTFLPLPAQRPLT